MEFKSNGESCSSSFFYILHLSPWITFLTWGPCHMEEVAPIFMLLQSNLVFAPKPRLTKNLFKSSFVLVPSGNHP